MKKFLFHRTKQNEQTEKAPKHHHSKKQNLTYGILIAVIVVFVICWWGQALTNAYYKAFVEYSDENASEIIESNSRMSIDTDVSNELQPLQEEFDSWRNRHLADQCSVVSQDGTTLHGLYYDCGFDRTVIVFQGYAVNSTGDFLYAPWYEQEQCNVLLTDVRSSGGSEGAYLSYGLCEQCDVAVWVDYARNELGNQNIYLHGIGMGTSAVLTAAGNGLLSGQVDGIVAESAFGSLHELAEYEMGYWFRLPTFPLLNLINAKMEGTVGYGLDDVNLTALVQSSEIPAVFLAAGADKYLPAEYSQEVYEAYAGTKRWLEVSDAEHGALYLRGKDDVQQAIKSLLDGTI
jgi:uncharacterized protein